MDRIATRTVALMVIVAAYAAYAASPLPAADADPLRDKALKLNEITGTSPMEGELRLLLKDEASTKKLVETAAKMLKEDPQPFNYTGSAARASHFVKNYDAAQAFYKIASEAAFKVQSSSRIIQVYDGLIDLFLETKKYDDAIKACREFLDIDSPERAGPINRVKPFVMERMIQAMAKKGKVEEAIKLANELIDADGDGWYFVRLKAEVYREAGQLEDAAKTYEEALERLRKLKDIEDDRRDRFSRGVRYVLSGVYVDLKKIDKAADHLKALVKKDPDNPTFKNDLGFIWADHDMNLDESEKLIREAIDLDRKQAQKNGRPHARRGQGQPRVSRQPGLGALQEEELQGSQEVPAGGDRSERRPAHRDPRPSRRRLHGARRKGRSGQSLGEGPQDGRGDPFEARPGTSQHRRK